MNNAMNSFDTVESHSPGIERLRTLYSIIPGAPSEKINLRSWRSAGRWTVGLYTHLEFKNLSKDQYVLDTRCGTTACAIGLACAYPEFKAQGLSWGESGLHPIYLIDQRTLVSWEAVSAFFEIPLSVAEHIFSGSEYGVKAKRRVMRRIRKYLVAEGVITKCRSAALKLEEKKIK